MAQGRDDSSGYEWEESIPTEPEPLMLPSHGIQPPAEHPHVQEQWLETDGADDEESTPFGAPSFTYDPQAMAAPEESDRRRGALPAWAIVGIVAVQAAALVAIVGLVLGGLQRWTSEEPAPPAASPSTEKETRSPVAQQAPEETVPGTVTDSTGRELTDGTGSYEDPATIGEHTVSWPSWNDGTLSVTALDIDLDATIPGAAGKDVVQDGYQLVLVAYEVRYDGPAQLAPAEELWLSGESQRTYFPEISDGLVTDPMRAISPLSSGESAQFHSAFLVAENEISSFRLGVQTFNGDILYFKT